MLLAQMEARQSLLPLSFEQLQLKSDKGKGDRLSTASARHTRELANMAAG